MRTRQFVAGAAVFAAAFGAGPVGAGAQPVATEITGLAAAFDRVIEEGGTTWCVYDVVVTLTHKGPVHVDMYAKDASGTVLSLTNTEVMRNATTYADELVIPLGATATFGASMGKHQGPNRFIVLDTYTAPSTTSCSPG